MQDYYEIAIKELEDELEELIAKANGLRYAIQTLRAKSQGGINVNVPINYANGFKPTVTSPVITAEPVPPKITAIERVKIVYDAVKQLNRFVKIKDIMNAIGTGIDPDLIRKALTLLHSENKIAKIQVTTSNLDNFYGLVEWKDGDIIKPEHFYDKTTVVGGILI